MVPGGPPSKSPGPLWYPVGPPGRPGPSVTMGVIDDEDDWNSESSEDDGDAQGSDDEVLEVIHPTSAAGVRACLCGVFETQTEK